MSNPFSVLMSVYAKEKPECFKTSIESVLQQTLVPNEIVIVLDGPLTKELYVVLDEFKASYGNLFKIVPLEKNVGLGRALAAGVEACAHELIARMDSDDISVPNRFEQQMKQFEKNSNLDICGGYIAEFSNSPEVIESIRTVPLNDSEIKKYHRLRDGLNHVTVMFKKSSVLAAGNYQHALFMEDSLLWANMFLNGATCINIPVVLVKVRTGEDMFQRRGGFAYFLKYRRGRKQIYDTGFISRWDYIYTLLVQFFVSMIPNSLRAFIFKRLLRS